MSDLSGLEELRRKLLAAQDRLRDYLGCPSSPFYPDKHKNLKKFIRENE